MAVQAPDAVSLHWQDLKRFDASTTWSEKIWRVVNNFILPAATVASFYGLATGKTRALPRVYTYLAYGAMLWAARKVLGQLISFIYYPAQVRYSKADAQKLYEEYVEKLGGGFDFQRISLGNSGTDYSAIIVTHKDTIANGKWSVHAGGNDMIMEQEMISWARENKENNCNTVLINGPNTAGSGGWATRYQLGAGMEAGLQYLEKEVKATHIIIKGLSLGGGMMAEAVMSHQFNTKKFRYLGISDRSFNYLSYISEHFAEYVTGQVFVLGPLFLSTYVKVAPIAAFVKFLVKPLFFITGTELDGVAGAKRLSDLGIQHIIIQHKGGERTDGIIPDAIGLAAATRQLDKIYVESPSILHNGLLPWDKQRELDQHIQKFLSQPALV